MGREREATSNIQRTLTIGLRLVIEPVEVDERVLGEFETPSKDPTNGIQCLRRRSQRRGRTAEWATGRREVRELF